jgi:putative peptide zinc metalloprotease protein
MSAALTKQGLRLRRDLICKKLDMAPRATWVLKDPLSRELHYVSEDEFAILKLLDGTRTLKDVLNACSNQFATRFVASESLVSFLADAKRRHLLVASPAASGNAALTSTDFPLNAIDRNAWTRFLAWKLPGIQVSHWLDAALKVLSPLIRPITVSAYVLLVISAAMIAIVHLPEILDDVTAAFLSRTSEALVQLFVVIAFAKIVHEFAHALTCRHFGGDCREMGVMLLMGMPCLYCDVSDAWLMPQRYKRILVSAAGMLAEIGLASSATFVWLFADDAVLRQWCLVVMTVCSVSSVLVNGNPLMRYDGYFILSDLWGIPNLGQKATQSLHRKLQWLMRGDSTPRESLDDSAPQGWLAVYAIASLIYRATLMLALAWVLYQFTAGHQIAVVGMLVGSGLVVATLVPEMRAIVAPERHGFVSRHHAGRKRMVHACIVFLIVMGMLIPLPRTLLVPMQIQPADSQTVFARVNGTLHAHVREGDVVNAGDLIATIDQSEVFMSLVEAESELATLVTTRLNLENSRQARPEISASLEAAKKAEDAARERVVLVKRENDFLSIRSPLAGVVFAESMDAASNEEDVETRRHGTLLDEFNRGIAVKPGEAICTIGSKTRREAILYVEQKQASLVRPGQSVELVINGNAGHRIQGKVIEVSSSPLQVTREQPIANAESDEGLYQVRTLLEDSRSPVPVRMTGKARVSVEPVSLASRLIRLFMQSIRF